MYTVFSYACLVGITIGCIYHIYKNKANFTINNEEEMPLKRHYLALALLLGLFLITRLYQLGNVPGGLHIDEFGMAYDALCLANYQVDRHLVRFPVYLINFGGGQNALYTYLTAIIFKVVGFSVVNARLAAVFSGLACFVCAYLIGKEIAGKTKTALIPPFLVTIIPYFFMSERWGLESHLLASYLMIAIYFVIKAVKTAKARFYILAGVFCGITLYTYAVVWTMLPVFLVFLLLYMIYIKKLTIKNTLAFSVSLLAFAWPLLLFLLVNNGTIPEIRTTFFSIVRVEYRGSEVTLSNIKDNLGLFKMMVTHGPWGYNAVPKYGTVYLFSIPLIFYGLVIALKRTYLALKEKKWDVAVLVSMLFVSVYCPLLLIAEPNINKINAIYPVFVLLIFLAIQSLVQSVKYSYWLLATVYLMAFAMFAGYYFGKYNNQEYDFFVSYSRWEETMEFVEETIEEPDSPVYIYEKPKNTYYVMGKDLYIRTYNGISPYEGSGRYQYENLGEIGANEEGVYVLDDSYKEEADKLGKLGWTRYEGIEDTIILYMQ